MECPSFAWASSSDINSVLPISQLYPTEPEDIPWPFDDLEMDMTYCYQQDLINYYQRMTVNKDEQHTPDPGFQNLCGPTYLPVGMDNLGTRQPQNHRDIGVAVLPSRPRFMGLDMPAQLIPEPEIGNRISDCITTPLDRSGPQISQDRIERAIPTAERNYLWVNPIPVTHEEMSQLAVGISNPTAQDLDWSPGTHQQLPCIGSNFRPHVRPVGQRMEYVPDVSDDSIYTNPALAEHQRAKSTNLSPIHRSDASIVEFSRRLSPNLPNLERRRSVPYHRLKRSPSREQGLKPTSCTQERSRIVGTQVFDVNMNAKVGRKKRRFSEGEKEQIAATRKRGACSECRTKKRKV